MRRLLLLASAATGAVLAAQPAMAQIPVTDAMNNLWQGLNNSQLVKQVQESVRQLQQMQQQYEVLQQQYAAIAHLPQNIEGMASSLSSGGMRDPMAAASQLGSMVNGLSSGGGPLGGIAENFRTLDRYADPTGTDPAAQEMMRNQSGIANIQALAMNNIASLRQRASSLGDFLDSIDGSLDVQQTAAIQARLQLEQNFVAAQQAQATNLQVLASAQAQVSQERGAEAARQDAADWSKKTAGVWTSGQ